MILVNGTNGIGTGFSTSVPPHDPEIIAQNLMNMMDDKPLDKMIPWFRGFKGKVEFKGINDYGVEQYVNKGVYKIVDATTVQVDALPIGTWIDKYKTHLESLLYDKNVEKKAKKQCLMDFANNSTEKTVNYTLTFKKEDLLELYKKNELESTLKMTDTSYTNYSNMHLYNSNGTIMKYDSPEEILKEFYFIRLAFYGRRKEYMLKTMKRELDIISAKVRFIEEFISGEINILHKEDEEIIEMLESRDYPKFGSEDVEEDDGSFSYEYLLNMKIKSLTKKKVEELKGQHLNKLALYNDLETKSEKDLWKADLQNFLDVYRKRLKEYNEKMDETKKSVKVVKTVKKAAKK
jgi:DNA topoisomerase-2